MTPTQNYTGHTKSKSRLENPEGHSSLIQQDHEKQTHGLDDRLRTKNERVDRAHLEAITRIKGKLREGFGTLRRTLVEVFDQLYIQGIDLDDVFKEDTEDIIFNFNYDLPIHKSQITNKLSLDFSASFKLFERNKVANNRASKKSLSRN